MPRAAATPAPAADPLSASQLIGREQFQKLLGISRPTFERWKSAGRLPPPIRFSDTVHRWRLVDVERFLADLAQQAR